MKTEEAVKSMEQYSIGSPVKVFKQEHRCNDQYDLYNGVVAGFDPTQTGKTIIVAYLNEDRANPAIGFLYLNESKDDFEICSTAKRDYSSVESRTIRILDDNIVEQKERLDKAEKDREIFLKNFDKFFGAK